MNNSIWHKYDIKDMPNLTREILARNGFHHNVCIINREDWEQGFCEWIDRWAYVADLISQADKAERLQKAVDLAKDTLYWYNDNYNSVVAQETINEITTLEQKEN